MHIKSDEDSIHMATISFDIPHPLRLMNQDITVTFTNITFRLVWSFGNVMESNQAIQFNYCRFFLTKKQYNSGLGKILQLFRVDPSANLKLTFRNSHVQHINKYPRRIIILLLSDDKNDDNIDITIVNTAFVGNIIIQMSSNQNRKIFIDQSEIKNARMHINGKDNKRESWATVDIQNTVFRSERLPDQLTLMDLPQTNITNVSFFALDSSNVLLKTARCENLVIMNSELKNGRLHAITGTSIDIQRTKFMASHLFLISLDTVIMSGITANESLIKNDMISQQIINNSKFLQSSVEIYKLDMINIEKVSFAGAYSDYALRMINCSDVKLSKSQLSKSSVRFEFSNVKLETTTFKETSGKNGGAIYNDGSNLNVSNVIFVNSQAEYQGGAIYNTKSGAPFLLKDTQFKISQFKNPAIFGTAIYSEGPMLFENVSFDITSPTNSPVIYLKTKSNDFLTCNDVTAVLGNFDFSCPLNHEIKIDFSETTVLDRCGGSLYEFFSIKCMQCQHGTYNLNRTSIKKIGNKTLPQKVESTCRQCPEQIVRRYFLEATDDASNSTIFPATRTSDLPDTCSKKTVYIVNNSLPIIQPKSNPCTNNRTGKFCRLCSEQFSTGLFTEKCVDKRDERNYPKMNFWIVYIVLTVLYAVILMYIKEIIVLINIKGMYLEIKKLFKTLFVPYDADDFFYDDNQVKNIPDVINEEFDMVEVNHQQIEMTPLNFNIGTVTAVIKIVFFFYQVETLLRTTRPSKLEKEIFIYSMLRDTVSSLLSLRISYSVDRFVSIPKANLNEIEKEFIRDCALLFFMIPVALFILFYLLIASCKSSKKRSNNTNQQSAAAPQKRKAEKVQGYMEDIQSNSLLSENENLHQKPQDEDQQTVLSSNKGDPVPSPPPNPIRHPIKKYFDRIDGKVPIYVWMPLSYRIKCFVVMIVILTYLPVSVFFFRLIYCIRDGDEYFLLMQPTVSCFNGFQFIAFGFVLLWVIPFPFALYVLSKMQYTCKIVPREFITALIFPPILLYYCFRNRICGIRRSCNIKDAMLAKHLLMILYECFRLQKNDRRYDVMWEVIFVARKLLLVIVAVCCPNRMKLFVMLIFLLLFLLHHIRMKPFSNPTMNGLESISLSLLSILCLFNIFWSIPPVASNHSSALYDHVIQNILLHIEYIILCFPIIFIVLFLLVAFVCFICNKTCCRNR